MLYRQIFAKIWEQIDSHDILLLNGARQTGKTTLLKMVQEKLLTEKNISPEQIHWFDLERIDDLNLWSNQSSVLSLSFMRDTRRHFLFIDEFQLSKTIGSTLKVIHDHYPHIKCLATGSASWHLSIDESMAGRKMVIPVWPLTFSEYIDWQNDDVLSAFWQTVKTDIHNLSAAGVETINRALFDFITYGGYPAVVKAQNQEQKINIVSELLSSYLMHDVQLWNHSIDVLQIKKALTLLASQIGGLLDIQSLAVNSGLGRVALMDRLDLFQNTFILHFLRPHFTNKIKELTKNPKVFLVDTGIYNNLMQDYSLLPQTPKFGQLAENFVVIELHKNAQVLDQIYFWRTKSGQETNIILRRGQKLIPIEVKSGVAENIPGGLKSFIKKYAPEDAYILNWNVVKDIEFNGCKTHFRPLWFKIGDL